MKTAKDDSQEHLFGNVCSLIAKYKIRPTRDISLHSRLGEDLYLVGDDAEEFLEDYARDFGVDMSSFRFDDYFPREASAEMHYYLASSKRDGAPSALASLVYLIEALFWSLFAGKSSFASITVADLVTAAQEGRWLRSKGIA